MYLYVYYIMYIFRCEVSLQRMNLEESSVVDNLLSDYKASKKTPVKLEAIHDGDSDLEREIKSLSKLQVLLNKSKTGHRSANKGMLKRILNYLFID